jgi:hypothetical protein
MQRKIETNKLTISASGTILVIPKLLTFAPIIWMGQFRSWNSESRNMG